MRHGVRVLNRREVGIDGEWERDVRLALRAVLADIEGSGYALRVPAVVRSADDSGLDVVYGGHRFPALRGATAGELAADVASRLQDDVVDDTGEAWPRSADGRR